jgi:SAM-dependent methyltransferase
MGLITSLFLYYVKGTKRKFQKLQGKIGSDPYMKYREIDLFSEILQNLKPQRVLEYGCGFSTLHFPKLLSEAAEWVSIEHNAEWYEQIAPRIHQEHSGVRVFHVKPDILNYPHDGYYEHFKSYVDFPEDKGPFDLILIDGMAREACIDKCLDMLSPTGLLVIHDCNRRKYHDNLKKYSNWLIMEDFRETSGGFGWASNTNGLHELADFKKHAILWKIDSNINNFFKFKFLIGKKSKPFRMISSGEKKISV